MPPHARVVKVAVIARRVAGLEAALAAAGARARYSLGANVAWVAWPGDRPLPQLHAALEALELAGMVLTGAARPRPARPNERRCLRHPVRAAIDPHARFLKV
ncbi:MAG: hypothetical protein ACYC91_14325 [Solirubrobacteraceae bacterium]